MKSLEIELVNGPGCQTKKVWVELTAKYRLRSMIGQYVSSPKDCRYSLKLDGNRGYARTTDIEKCYFANRHL